MQKDCVRDAPWDTMVIPHYTTGHHQGKPIFHGLGGGRDASHRNRYESYWRRRKHDTIEVYANLIDELREATHVWEFTTKHRATRRYDSKVKLMEMQEGDLILKEVIILAQQGKQQPNWEGPYLIYQKLPHGAYKLQELEGPLLPQTWNT